MTSYTCADVLAGRAPADAPVTVKGWVRTRRDSKAGISFVHVSDGSCFHPVQVVAPNTLANYASEVAHLTAGCAVAATGTIVPSPGEGAAVRDAGERDRGRRLGRRSGHLPDAAEAAHARVPARGRAPAPADQRHRRGDARAAHARAGDPPLLRPQRLLLGQHADHHRVGCRRRRRALPRLDARPREPAARRRRQARLHEGLLRPRDLPHRVGPAQRRELLPRAVEGLHVRPDVPRRELEHPPAPRRVLDDRARDRVREPRRQRDAGRGAPQARLQGGARRARRRHGVLRGADREGRDRQAVGDRRLGVRADGLHRRDPRAGIGEAEVRVPGDVGHRPAVRARALPGRDVREEARSC